MERRKHRLEPRQVLVRYALALSLLVVFVLGGHALHLVQAQQGKSDAEAINVSGAQRMLSQRIALLVRRHHTTQSPTAEQLLNDAVAQFERNHAWLISNVVAQNPELAEFYTGEFEQGLDAQVRDFVQRVRNYLSVETGTSTASALAGQLELIALHGLLSELASATDLIEDIATARDVRLQRLEYLVIAVTLVVLLLEVIFIFYPTHKALTKSVERLRYTAWNDPLTGLANRARFASQVEAMFSAGSEKLDRVFVLALDLDGFKDVNDTLGHPVGDQVLVSVARSIEATLVSADGLSDKMSARIGGDEFVVCAAVLEGPVADAAHALSQALIDAIEQPIPVRIDRDRMHKSIIGVSVGYAAAVDTPRNAEEFLSNADIALYESKRRGKGVATAFEARMREAAELRHHRTQEVKVALKSLEFQAYFQPQICLESGRLYGVEALARWRHPEHGILEPGQFMPFAEEANLIDALDGQIILNALEAFSDFRKSVADPGKLSINASGPALRASDFADVLARLTELNGLRPHDVTVELLEEVLVQGAADPVLTTLQSLADRGFGIAIDDFGVGQSSLSRVSNLPVSAIKVDRSLTLQSSTPAMQKIFSATAAIANGLGARLLAEGIETKAHVEQMQRHGVEVGQGHFWSGALTGSDLLVWYEQVYGADGAQPVAVSQ